MVKRILTNRILKIDHIFVFYYTGEGAELVELQAEDQLQTDEELPSSPELQGDDIGESPSGEAGFVSDVTEEATTIVVTEVSEAEAVSENPPPVEPEPE